MPTPRIAVAHFTHETVSFLPQETIMEDLVYPGSPAGGQALLEFAADSYIGGFTRMARELRDVTLVGLTSPLYSRRSSGSGWIRRDVFDTLVDGMVQDLVAQMPVDGIYLSLHGAMAVRDVPRPEAEIARRLRAVAGPDAPIVATFDLHGNEDEVFLEHADMAFAVKYYPHYDEYLQGERAARALIAMIEGRLKPAHAMRHLPLLTPTVAQWTGSAPWRAIVDRALTWEARKRDVVCNIYFGFPWSDVPDTGMSVQVFTNDDPELAAHICRDLCDGIWRSRAELVEAAEIMRIAEGVDAAETALSQGEGPVVLCDHSDRSGAATFLFAETRARDLPRALCATLTDTEVVPALLAAGARPGDPFDARVGGRLDASAGDPVHLKGRILAIGAGRPGPVHYSDITTLPFVAIAHDRGCVTVLTDKLVQILDPAWLSHYGVDAADFDMLLLKSRVHFRRGFMDGGFARRAILVEPDEPFLGTARLEALPFTAIDPAAFYPLNRDVSFDPA